MNNFKKAVVISNKFQEQIETLNIYDQLTCQGDRAYAGSIVAVDSELHILRDEHGKDVCGILDCKSFLEALMDTEVAHLWVPKGAKGSGTIN